MTQNLENTQLSLIGITGSVLPADINSLKAAGLFTPPPTKQEGWDGNAFYFHGKKFVVAISPEISKNGLHELRTYCYTGDKQAVPSEKLTTIVTETSKQLESTRTRTMGVLADNTKTADKKCLICGKVITWGRKNVKYCGDICKQKAYSDKKDGNKCL